MRVHANPVAPGKFVPDQLLQQSSASCLKNDQPAEKKLFSNVPLLAQQEALIPMETILKACAPVTFPMGFPGFLQDPVLIMC